MQLVVMCSAQRYHKQVMRFGTHSTLPVANQVVGSSAGLLQQLHCCDFTQRVYLSFSQRRRFGLSMKDSGDSGSTFTETIFLTFSWRISVAGNDGTMSLSRITELCDSGLIRSAWLATDSGIRSARSLRIIHQQNSGSVRVWSELKPSMIFTLRSAILPVLHGNSCQSFCSLFTQLVIASPTKANAPGCVTHHRKVL